jgi:hypothetical protein
VNENDKPDPAETFEELPESPSQEELDEQFPGEPEPEHDQVEDA